MIPLSLIALSSTFATTVIGNITKNTDQHLTAINGVYSDSTRHISWKLDIPDGMDTTIPQPAFLEFHGDLGASEELVLDLIEPYCFRWALPQKAYGISFAGQDVATGAGRRLSGSLDGPLLLAAIRGNMGGLIKIDTTKIIMHGMSSGGGFLDYLLQKQQFGWGGGMFIQCGIHNVMNDPIPADTARARNYRVFVATSKDDPLWAGYYPILEHAKYWLGYDVRATTAGSGGGHCSTLEETKDSGIQWLFHKLALDSGAYKQTFVPHWQGIAAISGVKGVAATPLGDLYAATSVNNFSYVYKSEDDGVTWRTVWSLKDSGSFRIGGIANVGESVVFTHLHKLYHLRPGLKITSQTIDSISPPVASDGAGRVWLKGATWRWTKDTTWQNWNSVPADWTMPAQFARGALAGIDSIAPHFVRMHDSSVIPLIPNSTFTSADSAVPPLGRILTSTRRGDTVLATVWNGTKQQLYVRIGGTWTTLTWPVDGYTADATLTGLHELSYWPDSRPIVMGKTSYQANASGAWSRMPGVFSTVVNEPTAFLADNRILRTSASGYGLLLWVNKETRTNTAHPTSIQSPVTPRSPIHRVGSYLELPKEGGPWEVRWLDAAGRVRSRAAYGADALVPLRPQGASNIPLWVEVAGPQTRTIVPAVR